MFLIRLHSKTVLYGLNLASASCSSLLTALFSTAGSAFSRCLLAAEPLDDRPFELRVLLWGLRLRLRLRAFRLRLRLRLLSFRLRLLLLLCRRLRLRSLRLWLRLRLRRRDLERSRFPLPSSLLFLSLSLFASALSDASFLLSFVAALLLLCFRSLDSDFARDLVRPDRDLRRRDRRERERERLRERECLRERERLRELDLLRDREADFQRQEREALGGFRFGMLSSAQPALPRDRRVTAPSAPSA